MLSPLSTALLGIGLLAGACTSHEVEFKPIHLTIDINLRIQQELDDFFDFEEELDLPEPTGTEGGRS